MTEGKTIIVIDDEVRICQSFEKVLTRAGYGVESFSNGADALERMKAGGVDLVVSDLMMPEKSGVEVLKEMRGTGIETHLVMITGYASIENALETMRFGALDYLPKPFTVAELKAVVARGLRAGEVDLERLPPPPGDTYEILRHSWARLDEGGMVLVGVHPFALECCGPVTAVELPMEEDEVIQGGACGNLIAQDSRIPLRLWAPVSGDVGAVNSRAVENPSILKTDPYGEGWLLKIKPSRLQNDLKELVVSKG